MFEEVPSRWGLIRRDATDDSAIQWFTCEPCFVFHFFNAHEETDANTGEVTVVLTGCRTRKMDLDEIARASSVSSASSSEASCASSGLSYADEMRPLVHEWRFNISSGASSERILQRTEACEFPRVHPALVGRKARIGWAVRVLGVGDAVRVGESPQATAVSKGVVLDACLKLDLETGRVLARHVFGDGCYGGECVFVPRTPLSPLTRDLPIDEEDGFLLTYIHTLGQSHSRLLVLDATDLKPLCELQVRSQVSQEALCSLTLSFLLSFLAAQSSTVGLSRPLGDAR